MLSGCAMVKVDPESNELTYIRWGDQHISGLVIDKTDANKVKVSLEGQASEAQALSEAISAISTLSTKLAQ